MSWQSPKSVSVEWGAEVPKLGFGSWVHMKENLKSNTKNQVRELYYEWKWSETKVRLKQRALSERGTGSPPSREQQRKQCCFQITVVRCLSGELRSTFCSLYQEYLSPPSHRAREFLTLVNLLQNCHGYCPVQVASSTSQSYINAGSGTKDQAEFILLHLLLMKFSFWNPMKTLWP